MILKDNTTTGGRIVLGNLFGLLDDTTFHVSEAIARMMWILCV